MRFNGYLTEGILLKRYFRFLVEVALKNNKRRMIYCPNLGRLNNCDILGTRIWFSTLSRLSQGYLDILELAEVERGALVSINPQHAERLVREAIESGIIKELEGFHFLQTSIMPNLGKGIELLLKEDGKQCFIHIQPITSTDERGEGYCSTDELGTVALRQLLALKENNHRAVLLYCIQHTGISVMRPADGVDPVYTRLLREAVQKGVEVLAYRANINLSEMVLEASIPVLFSEDIISR